MMMTMTTVAPVVTQVPAIVVTAVPVARIAVVATAPAVPAVVATARVVLEAQEALVVTHMHALIRALLITPRTRTGLQICDTK